MMPGVAAFFTLAGLSSLGLPGTAGFVAEFLVFAGGWQSPRPWWSICGVIGAFVTAVYVLRVSRAVFFGDGPSDHFHDLRDVRKIEWAPLWILGGTLLLCGIWPRLLLDFIDPTTTNYLRMAFGLCSRWGVLPLSFQLCSPSGSICLSPVRPCCCCLWTCICRTPRGNTCRR